MKVETKTRRVFAKSVLPGSVRTDLYENGRFQALIDRIRMRKST